MILGHSNRSIVAWDISSQSLVTLPFSLTSSRETVQSSSHDTSILFHNNVNRKLYTSYERISRHDIGPVSHQSRKHAKSATAPTAAPLKPRPLAAGPAPEVELADEELEPASSVAEAVDEDTELLLPVALDEELRSEDCEAVDEAVSVSDEEASEVLLDVAEPLPVVEAGAATARNCQCKAHIVITIPKENSQALPMSCTKVKALEPNVDCQQAKYEAPPLAPAVVASTAVLHMRPGLTSHGTALPEAAKSVLDEHAV